VGTHVITVTATDSDEAPDTGSYSVSVATSPSFSSIVNLNPSSGPVGTFVTIGGNGNLPLADYATTAWVPDGSLAVIYDPAGNALTVNLANFSQPVTAAWYDPSNGVFNVIAGSPFPNSGTQVFTPVGNNQDGDADWVLLLEVNPVSPSSRKISQLNSR
jgi:hypothetical protein